MSRSGRGVPLSLFGLAVFLAVESIQPAERQVSARACLGLIEAYQSVGSPVARAGGVRCRYTPTCSHYAHDAIETYGTVGGLARMAGRLWRCSPWGGCGYDPAMERPIARLAYLSPQETPEEKRAREQAEKDMQKAREEAEKAAKELEKAFKEGGKGCALAGVGCAIAIILSLGLFVLNILLMVWVYKDAKARGDQNAIIWLVLMFFFPLVGLIVYVFVRPKGNLFPCPNCKNKRMETLTKCPHCGAETGAAKA